MPDVAGTWVTIKPDLDQFAEDLEAGLEPIVESSDKSVNIGADTADAQAKVLELRGELEALNDDYYRRSVLAGPDVDEALAKIAEVEAELEALGHDPYEVRVTADTSEAEAKIAALDAEAEGSRVGGGVAEQASGIAALRSQMGAIQDTLDDVQFSVGGLTRRFNEADEAAEDLSNSLSDVEAAAGGSGRGAAGGLSAVGSAAGDANSVVHPFVTTLVALAPALASIGEVAIGGTFVALPGMFAGAAAGGLALAGVFTDLKNAVENELKPAWDSFKQLDLSTFMDAAAQGVRDLVPLFQELEPYALAAAKGMGQFITAMGAWSQSATGIETINALLQEGNAFMSDLSHAAQDFFEGFAQTGAQAGSILSGIGRAVENVAAGFKKWSADGGASTFISMIKQEAPSVEKLLGQLVSTFTDITKAFAEAGPALDPILTAVLHLADDLAKANPLLFDFAAVFAGVKLLSGLAGVASKLSGLGGDADAATSKVGRLSSTLSGLAGKTFTVFLDVDIAEEIAKVTGLYSALGNEPGPSAITSQSGLQSVQEGIKSGASRQSLQENVDSINGELKKLGDQLLDYNARTNTVSLAPGAKKNKKTSGSDDSGDDFDYNSPKGSGGSSSATTLQDAVNSMLSTLGSLAAPAKNAVASQQTALSNNAPAFNTLISRLVAAHTAAMSELVVELVAAHKAAEDQLNQLMLAQNLTSQAARRTDEANARSTQIGDGSKLSADRAANTGNGNSPVTAAQVVIDKIQEFTDSAIAKAQAGVTAAANSGPVAQAAAAKTLAFAEAAQKVQLAGANATLNAAQTLQSVASSLAQAAQQSASDKANAFATSIGDAAQLASDQQAAALGGNTPSEQAQVHLDEVQGSTDNNVADKQARLDALNDSKTASKAQKDAANKQLEAAQNDQLQQVALAKAALQAAQDQETAATAQITSANTIAQDIADAASQMTSDMSTAATDISNGMSQLVSDASAAFTDWANATVAAIQDAAATLHDTVTGEIAQINDQSQTTIDELGEAGLSGYALQAQQAKIALDQMTSAYDQQINALQVGNVDAAKAAQDQLVAAAQANLAGVTSQTQAVVNTAQQNLDGIKSSNDATVAQFQQVVDRANATITSQAYQNLQDAKQQAEDQEASAQSGLAAAQAAAQALVSAAQAQLAQAQGNASILEAQGSAALQAVQDQADLAEAEQQAIYNKLNAQANGSGGLTVNVEINGIPDALSGIDALMFELKSAGAL